VAYDEELAHRIRELLSNERGVQEKKMFGGLAFLVGGNMAIAASGQGGVLVRVDPAQSDRIVAGSHAEEAVMRGRPMTGWLRVAAEHLSTKRQLEKWVRLGADYAHALPDKATATR
jgi:TfoX/Sxy family transcriptional regulator of competence genes